MSRRPLGTRWAVLGKLSLVPLGLAITALLARLLTPADLGALALLAQAVIVASLLATRGVEHAILAPLGGLGEDRPDLARSLVRRQGVRLAPLAILSAAVSGLVARWLVPDAASLWVLAALIAVWSLGAAVQRYLFEAFRGLGWIPSAVLFGGQQHFGGIASSVTIALALGLGWMAGGMGLVTAVAVFALATVAAGVAGTTFLAFAAGPGSSGGDVESPTADDLADAQVAPASPLFINNLTQYLGRRLDVWVGALILTDAELGLYATVAVLPVLLNLPLTAVNVSITSEVGRLLKAGSVRRVRELVGRMGGYAALAGVAAGVVLVLFGRPILSIAFGPYFVSGYMVLVWLSLAQIASLGVASSGWVLLMAGYGNDLMWTSIVGAVVTAFAAFFLGRAYGPMGVAAGVSLGMITQQFGKLVLARVRLGMWFWARPLRAAGGMLNP